MADALLTSVIWVSLSTLSTTCCSPFIAIRSPDVSSSVKDVGYPVACVTILDPEVTLTFPEAVPALVISSTIWFSELMVIASPSCR